MLRADHARRAAACCQAQLEHNLASPTAASGTVQGTDTAVSDPATERGEAAAGLLLCLWMWLFVWRIIMSFACSIANRPTPNHSSRTQHHTPGLLSIAAAGLHWRMCLGQSFTHSMGCGRAAQFPFSALAIGGVISQPWPPIMRTPTVASHASNIQSSSTPDQPPTHLLLN